MEQITRSALFEMIEKSTVVQEVVTGSSYSGQFGDLNKRLDTKKLRIIDPVKLMRLLAMPTEKE